MSNLKELKNTVENPLLLLKEIKNSGVEFKKLENLFNIRNGYTPSKKNESYWSGNTIIPWFRLEDIRENGRVLKDSIQHVTPEGVRGEAFKKDSLIISTTATIGEYALIESDFLANQQFTILTLKEEYKEKLLPKFLLHYACILSQYCKNNVNGITFKMVDMSKFRNFEIPIPPLEVQAEIVRILDIFTKDTNELIDLLKKEQELRKKQYSYYLDELLTFGEDTQRVKLGEVAEIGTGRSNTNEQLEEGLYPFFVRSPIVRRKNDFEFDETAIITAGDGDVGKVFHYIEGKYALHQRAYRIHITKENIVSKFVYYFMTNSFYDYISKKAYSGTVKSIRMSMLTDFIIPLPPIDTQKRIVDILDNLERYTNDLQEGLPAEIEKRKKQYAYYRDELLRFERK